MPTERRTYRNRPSVSGSPRLRPSPLRKPPEFGSRVAPRRHLGRSRGDMRTQRAFRPTVPDATLEGRLVLSQGGLGSRFAIAGMYAARFQADFQMLSRNVASDGNSSNS